MASRNAVSPKRRGTKTAGPKSGNPSMKEVALASVATTAEGLQAEWNDGRTGLFHAIWLHDNCACPQCRHPGNGQRLFDAADIHPEVRAESATIVLNGHLAISWAPDAHKSVYEASWLRIHCNADWSRQDRRPSPTLWNADLAPLPTGEHDVVHAEVANHYTWLSNIRDLGFAILRGVPTDEDEILRAAQLIGYVRETNYGRTFDVVAVNDPTNLAYTPAGLQPHTDNPYRDPVPGLQLLHCLQSSATGGHTLLIDGFAVADALRQTDADAFDILTSTPHPFRFPDGEADLRAAAPLIECNRDGDVVAVCHNNRSAAPLALPEDEVATYYTAYRRLMAIYRSPGYALRLRLEPGDLLVLDNTRVLHGRETFEATGGQRHLKGRYVDKDGFNSRLRLLGNHLGRGGDDPARPGADGGTG